MLKIYGRKNLKNFPLLYIQIFILLKFVKPNLINSENLIRINNYDSEIHLIINGTGNQSIINKSFQYSPYEVIVNGYVNNTCNKTCFLTEDINNVTLKFSEQIMTCAGMFQYLDNIIEINLSNFDVSLVNSTKHMFRNCLNLKKIILSNFNTYNLVNMSHMFYNCSNLEEINFGNINTSSVVSMQYLFCHCPKLTSIDLSKFEQP